MGNLKLARPWPRLRWGPGVIIADFGRVLSRVFENLERFTEMPATLLAWDEPWCRC